MSIRLPHPARVAHGATERGPAGHPELREGVYLTDGRRLLRVVSQFSTAPRRFAALEDCRTLDVRRYSPLELWRMNLRPVVPASDPASTSHKRRSDAGARRRPSPLRSR